MKPDKFHLQYSVETDEGTGDVIAVYFKVRKGKAAATKEVLGGKVFADYNSKGELLGVEMLGPCEVKVLDQITEVPRERQFILSHTPRAMLLPSASAMA
jgi:uncharacterized protein YuzE